MSMDASQFPHEPAKPIKSLDKMFDLSGDQKIADYVAKFEDLFRQRDAVAADLKQLADDAREDMLSKRELEAVKKIAKWRLDDKISAAKEMFAALQRVSKAVQIEMF